MIKSFGTKQEMHPSSDVLVFGSSSVNAKWDRLARTLLCKGVQEARQSLLLLSQMLDAAGW